MKTTDLKTKGSLNPLSISIFLIFSVIFVMLFALGVINIFVFIISMAFSVLLSNSIHIADQWERAVVLRMGKYSGLKGPGLFMIIPIIDRVSTYIDQRVRVSAFKAEQTLTKDTVPVNVDTVVYWTVWDVEKAALEVQEYQTAIEQIAQTGLRDTIGKHELSTLLQERDKIAEDLQQVLDKNTNPWGITCQTVGIKDIAIPKDLAEAMSKEAQAERERRARVILGTAETEIAEKFSQAGQKYTNNPVALHLRGMNMLFEGLKEKGSMVIVPSSALESMNLGAIGGIASLSKMKENVI
ncbi:slipin family protein (plasmid) [Parabacteroides distasonis]|nr:slipin family protein [Parabacteroides distasonis]